MSSVSKITPTPAEQSNTVAYVKLVLCALFWGATFVAGRSAMQTMPPLSVATGRFIVASLLLLLIAYRAEGGLPRLSRNQIWVTLALGITGIALYNLFFFGALQRMPAGKTALLVALSPILVAVTVAVIMKEKLGPYRWGGIALALIGTLTIVTRGDILNETQSLLQSFGWGELFMLAAIISWVGYTVISRFALRGLSPIAATTYATLWGTLILALGALTEIHTLRAEMLTWQSFLTIFYLGSFGSAIAFIWYNEGVKKIGPARTVVFTNLVPVFGVLLSYLILDEPIYLSMIVGGAIVIAGVTLTNQAKK
ncbi:DMT family transporter [Zwartia sp.]|uniref:DMT family transporter n=1 Tax=Zwartia sp. TaxID=2978004 RepID=UPI002724FEF9|nr:DMT family transporter [Zwartia sp.]MDO9026014.1 DMT family transporter [Zwartia sp.]